jgi:diguanylate cyclase (GGDEF)-like protein
LRWYFLAPLILAILAAGIAPIVGVYSFTQRNIGVGDIQMRKSAIEIYDDMIRQHTRALEMVLDILYLDAELRKALAAQDRQALLRLAAPIYERMNRAYGITHLYFQTPDRVNLLRAHNPKRYGDVIDRATMRLAESTGATVSGVEFGSSGTLTLRVIQPWFEEGTRRLIGYVETGLETVEVVEQLSRSLGAEEFTLVRKDLLDRIGWEEGMRLFGRTPNWNEFPDYALIGQTLAEMPPALRERVAHDQLHAEARESIIESNQDYYRLLFMPLVDIRGRTVGTVVMLVNVSREIAAARASVLLGGIAYLAGGALLLAFFYRLVGWTGGRIENDQRRLEQLAVLDPLTGLHNHGMYVSVLNSEIARAQRDGRPVSVLFLDLDHFKRINNEYGHLAGDQVLQRVGLLLGESAPHETSVCRYGGEVFAVIMPGSDVESAAELAERLRRIVEQRPIATSKDKEIRITVSIGVAAFPEMAGSADELTRVANLALYEAKKSGRNRVSRYNRKRSTVS